MTTRYENPRALCEAVRALAEPSVGRLTPRPFNPFDPNKTSWWLVPSTAQPHHKFCRFHFAFDQFDSSSLLCGIHLHKGLDPELAPVFTSKRGKALLMDASWAWPRFTAAAAGGDLQRTLIETMARLSAPALINVDGGYVNEPSEFDPYTETRQKTDFYRFEARPDGGVNVVRSDRKAFILKLHNVETVTSLGGVLSGQLGTDPWLWLGVFVCASFKVKALAEEKGGEEWDANRIWDGFLSRLSRWVKD